MTNAIPYAVDFAGNDSRILVDPAPSISLAELADSSVNFNVRPWVQAADYWGVRSDLLKKVKEAFDQHGISIPYPQQDVHYHGIAINQSA